MEGNAEDPRKNRSCPFRDSIKGFVAFCFGGLLCASLLLVFVEKEKLKNSCKSLSEERDEMEATSIAVVEERDELLMRVSVLESILEIKVYAVDVTLDPDTAYPGLFLSADRKQMRYEDAIQNLPDTPKRFDSFACVLGKEGFSSRKFYFEVDVTMTTDWDLGVAAEFVDRKESFRVSPKFGYWQLWLRNQTMYEAIDSSNILLSLEKTPQVIGVFVNYEEGLISFYDADTWYHIYSFTNASFTTKIYPSFCLNKFNETLIIRTN